MTNSEESGSTDGMTRDERYDALFAQNERYLKVIEKMADHLGLTSDSLATAAGYKWLIIRA